MIDQQLEEEAGVAVDTTADEKKLSIITKADRKKHLSRTFSLIKNES
jgi:hypothetical protein